MCKVSALWSFGSPSTKSNTSQFALKIHDFEDEELTEHSDTRTTADADHLQLCLCERSTQKGSSGASPWRSLPRAPLSPQFHARPTTQLSTVRRRHRPAHYHRKVGSIPRSEDFSDEERIHGKGLAQGNVRENGCKTPWSRVPW